MSVIVLKNQSRWRKLPDSR